MALTRTGASRYHDGHLTGVLLGDGYLRERSIVLCNQTDEVRDLVEAALPDGAKLNPLRIGQAGTGSAEIIGQVHGINPVLMAFRSLELTGKRAWQKMIPACYMEAPLEVRLSVVQGLLDTDGTADKHGRIEFSSSSERLTRQLLELIHGLGGRARLVVDDKVMWTSPRQRTPKPGRTAYRLINVRLPEDLPPFRRPSKSSRVRPGRSARQWTIKSVEAAGRAAALAVEVTAPDGQWITDGPVALLASKASSLEQWAAA